MPGGAVSQAVGTGQQDLYLTSDPSITWFRSTFRRYCPFGIESVQISANSQVRFGAKGIFTIGRIGDLAGFTYVEANLPALTANTGETVNWVRYPGHVLLQQVDFVISGGRVDRLVSEWLHIWYELTCSSNKSAAYSKMIGDVSALTTPASSIAATTLFIPLPLWWCTHYGLSLPILAMQFNVCSLEISFAPITSLYQTSDGVALTSPTDELSASLWTDYIFLDTPERTTIAEDAHQILVTTLQFNGFESYSSPSIRSRLTLNHPVSMIVWVTRLIANETLNNWCDFSLSGTAATAYNGTETVASANLTLNGNERYQARPGQVHNYLTAYKHFSRCPQPGINVYSHSLFPEIPTPTGSQNYSRIDQAILNLNTYTGSRQYHLGVFARTYNLFRIKAGQSGLTFSS